MSVSNAASTTVRVDEIEEVVLVQIIFYSFAGASTAFSSVSPFPESWSVSRCFPVSFSVCGVCPLDSLFSSSAASSSILPSSFNSSLFPLQHCGANESFIFLPDFFSLGSSLSSGFSSSVSLFYLLFLLPLQLASLQLLSVSVSL
uniref:Uncharacterized protein n=1 Tax=Ciona intestinalis TaxID=7719 RepID=F7B0Y3_CIOIN